MLLQNKKPIRPIEPLIENYSRPLLPNGTNYLGQPLFQKLDWIEDYKKWKKNMVIYEKQLEEYEQLKLLRLINNSTQKYFLKTFKIIKR